MGVQRRFTPACTSAQVDLSLRWKVHYRMLRFELCCAMRKYVPRGFEISEIPLQISLRVHALTKVLAITVTHFTVSMQLLMDSEVS